MSYESSAPLPHDRLLVVGRGLRTYIGIVSKSLAVVTWPTYSGVMVDGRSSASRAAKVAVA